MTNEVHEFLNESTFNDDAYSFFEGLVVKHEKVGDAYMITIDEGRTWANLYTSEEANMSVFNRMRKRGER